MTVRVVISGDRQETALLASLIGRVPGVSLKPAFIEPHCDTIWRHYDADVDAEAVRKTDLEQMEREAEP